MARLFSVVVPTLQRSPRLGPLLRELEASRHVGEILVVNNAPEPLAVPGPKTRVLQQEHNIFVNPAWNLGVAQARFPLVALLNDDIAFPLRWLGSIARFLTFFRPGVVGMGTFSPGVPLRWRRPPVPLFYPASARLIGYGTALFLAREHWDPVPEQLKIFYGDDWVFHRQRRLNWAVLLPGFETEMSVTSGEPVFHARMEDERQLYEAVRPETYQRLHPRLVRWAELYGRARRRLQRWRGR